MILTLRLNDVEGILQTKDAWMIFVEKEFIRPFMSTTVKDSLSLIDK